MVYRNLTRDNKSIMDTVDVLILDLLEWVAMSERTYAEVMDAWRTSCPRLPVWENATQRGLITREHANGRALVRITSAGVALLEQHRPSSRGEASLAGVVVRRTRRRPERSEPRLPRACR